MKALLIGLVILVHASRALAYPMVPNEQMTPGHLCTNQSGDFQSYRYQAKVPYCKRNVSQATKRKVYDAYGIPTSERRDYTIDHFFPLSMGGSNDPRNLWPEHKQVKARRPHLENELFEDLAKGRKSQREVLQRIIAAKLHP